MKAYRLKIIVKNTKPPIWRRAFIPEGITFSQLAHVINTIFELEPEENFEFECYQRKIQLREAREGAPIRSQYSFDYQEASDTVINDYFDDKEWVTYRYGKEMSFRVEPEMLAPNYTYGCPIVEKFVGVLSQKALSEEISKEVNRQLKERFPLKITDEPVYEDFETISGRMEKNDYGLYVAKEPVTRQGNIRKSGLGLLRDFVNSLKDAFAEQGIEKENLNLAELLLGMPKDEEGEVREPAQKNMQKSSHADKAIHPMPKPFYLKQAVASYSERDLRKFAEELHLRGYTSMPYKALCEKVANELLRPSIMKQRMSTLSDAEIAAFEAVLSAEEGYAYGESQQDIMEHLYELDYIFLPADEDIAYAAVDVAEVYHKINTEEYHARRRKICWLKDCLDVVPLYYWVIPLRAFGRIYRKRPGFSLKNEEIAALFPLLPEEENACVLLEDKIVAKVALKEEQYLAIERRQGDTPFYIPKWQEVEELAEHGYPAGDPGCKKLAAFFQKYLKYGQKEAESAACDTWFYMSRGHSAKYVIKYLEEDDIFLNGAAQRAFLVLNAELRDHTRMLLERGYTYDELDRREADRRKLLEEHLTIPSAVLPDIGKAMGTPAKKIYPNDPCPCGSGKKYKKCCGR